MVGYSSLDSRRGASSGGGWAGYLCEQTEPTIGYSKSQTRCFFLFANPDSYRATGELKFQAESNTCQLAFVSEQEAP